MPAKKKPKKVFMSRLDYLKYEYQKDKLIKELSGKVEVKENMYTDISKVPSLKEIEAMPKESGKKLLETVKQLHKVKDIINHLGINETYLRYKLYKKFDVALMPRKERTKKEKEGSSASNKGLGEKVTSKKGNVTNIEFYVPEKSKKEVEPEVKELVVPICNKIKPIFTMALSQGSYSGNELIERIIKFDSLMTKSSLQLISVNIKEMDGDNEWASTLRGLYEGEKASKRILKLGDSLDPEATYEASITIGEVQEIKAEE